QRQRRLQATASAADAVGRVDEFDSPFGPPVVHNSKEASPMPAVDSAAQPAADEAASPDWASRCCGGDRPTTRRLLVSLALGQLLSLFICGTAVTSGYLQRFGVNAPTSQCFLNYLLLGLTFGSVAFYRLGRAASLRAAASTPLAYAYTSVTSVQLLDCASIPVALISSWFLLGARFKACHYVGVAACVLGAGGMALADVLAAQHAGDSAPPAPLLGDALVLAGGALYGLSNVWQEHLVRRYERLLYIGCVGILGALVGGVQLLLLERRELGHLLAGRLAPGASPAAAIGAAVGFALCMYALYSLMPVAMTTGSAVLVNLSLLTADLYALFVGVYLFGYSFHPLYFVSYAAILLGLAAYAVRQPKMAQDPPARRHFLRAAPAISGAGASSGVGGIGVRGMRRFGSIDEGIECARTMNSTEIALVVVATAFLVTLALTAALAIGVLRQSLASNQEESPNSNVVNQSAADEERPPKAQQQLPNVVSMAESATVARIDEGLRAPATATAACCQAKQKRLKPLAEFEIQHQQSEEFKSFFGVSGCSENKSQGRNRVLREAAEGHFVAGGRNLPLAVVVEDLADSAAVRAEARAGVELGKLVVEHPAAFLQAVQVRRPDGDPAEGDGGGGRADWLRVQQDLRVAGAGDGLDATVGGVAEGAHVGAGLRHPEAVLVDRLQRRAGRGRQGGGALVVKRHRRQGRSVGVTVRYVAEFVGAEAASPAVALVALCWRRGDAAGGGCNAEKIASTVHPCAHIRVLRSAGLPSHFVQRTRRLHRDSGVAATYCLLPAALARLPDRLAVSRVVSTAEAQGSESLRVHQRLQGWQLRPSGLGLGHGAAGALATAVRAAASGADAAGATFGSGQRGRLRFLGLCADTACGVGCD
uniref:DUF803 domain-containing protein n=1 Tax=Macrostomum lignano TaxID=282301 RepID=A0A1I8HE03_9PLAT